MHCLPSPERRLVRQLSSARVRPVEGHQIRLVVRKRGPTEEKRLFALFELASGALQPTARSPQPSRAGAKVARRQSYSEVVAHFGNPGMKSEGSTGETASREGGMKRCVSDRLAGGSVLSAYDGMSSP